MKDLGPAIVAASVALVVATFVFLAYQAGVDKRAHALECAKLKGYWNGDACHAVKP